VVGSASVDYLMFAGYVVMAYSWALMAEKALEKLAKPDVEDRDFLEAKVETARFYFQRMLPRTQTHLRSMTADTSSVMALREECFKC
jgi:hypothetical protein